MRSSWSDEAHSKPTDGYEGQDPAEDTRSFTNTGLERVSSPTPGYGGTVTFAARSRRLSTAKNILVQMGSKATSE